IAREPVEARASTAQSVTLFGTGVLVSLTVLWAYQWSAFGNPFLPAQSYMPPARYTELGYRGMSLPRLDLLLETMFSIRYGLFTSAPLLLLALYFPAWTQRGGRVVGVRELACILIFCALSFLFASANQ